MTETDVDRARAASVGQVLQNIGKAAVDLRRGRYEAAIYRLLPYLTRTDLPVDLREQMLTLYQSAVRALSPRIYSWEAEVARGERRTYIPVPRRYVPLHGGEKVKVVVEVL